MINIIKMMISYSQINTYRECPAKYYYRYYKKYPEPETEALRQGKLFHEEIFKDRASEEQLERMRQALWENEDFIKTINDIKELEKTEVKKIGKYWYKVIYDGITDDSVIEFKSSRSPWKDFDNLIQPHLYLKVSGKKKFKYFIVTKAKKPKVQFKEIEFDPKEWKKIKENAEHIMKDFLFLANPGKHCYYCSFQKHCPLYF